VNYKKHLKIILCVTLSFGIKYWSNRKSPLMMIKTYVFYPKRNINFSVCVISNKKNLEVLWIKLVYEFFGNAYICWSFENSKVINKRFFPYLKFI
jgi:hypothetical protein